LLPRCEESLMWVEPLVQRVMESVWTKAMARERPKWLGMSGVNLGRGIENCSQYFCYILNKQPSMAYFVILGTEVLPSSFLESSI
jgi:hypothetical protein